MMIAIAPAKAQLIMKGNSTILTFVVASGWIEVQCGIAYSAFRPCYFATPQALVPMLAA